MKVIGAGFGRTGTLSLKLALEQLGFDKCYHMLEVNHHPWHFDLWARAHAGESIRWDDLFSGYQSAVDWPSCNLWREQAAYFPDARILLSRRDPESWYTSIMNTIYPGTVAALNSDDEKNRAFGEWAMNLIWRPIFDDRMDDQQHVMDVFEKHNQSVINEVPRERLLVFEAKQGWAPLCEFLGVPVPETDYPRVNTTAQFNENR